MHIFLGAVPQMERHLAPHWVLRKQRGGAVLFGLGIPIPPREDIEAPFRIRYETGADESDCLGQGAR